MVTWKQHNVTADRTYESDKENKRTIEVRMAELSIEFEAWVHDF